MEGATSELVPKKKKTLIDIEKHVDQAVPMSTPWEDYGWGYG